jgi:hypothetical protein
MFVGYVLLLAALRFALDAGIVATIVFHSAGRFGSPAALLITASFFFLSETAGLMFVRHCWLRGFRW